MSVSSATAAWGQSDPNRPSGPVLSSELTRRLWETRISLPDPNADMEAKDDLQSLIHRVRSLKFGENKVTPSFSAPEESQPVAEPNRNVARQPRTAPAPSAPVSEATPMTGSLQSETLEQLSALAQNPDQVSNPFEVAELLFLSGHLVEAIPFYESALAKTSRTDAATSSDRAWILFQLGNCLRKTDMARARDTYQKLVAEHPDSPWAELARAHGRLISWYLATKPDQLLTAP